MSNATPPDEGRVEERISPEEWALRCKAMLEFNGVNIPDVESFAPVARYIELALKVEREHIKDKLRKACFDGKTYTKRISFVDLIPIFRDLK